MRLRDTPKTPRKSRCIWLGMIQSVILLLVFNTNANAANINEIDKYKIYIHIKVMSYKEFVCIESLWSKENTSWDPYAKNPKSSAFGIPQLLKLKELNPYVQMDLGYKYIVHRHQTPCQAWSFWKRHRYY